MRLPRLTESFAIPPTPVLGRYRQHATQVPTRHQKFGGLSATRVNLSTGQPLSPIESSPLSSLRGRQAINLLPSYLTDARSVTKYSKDFPEGALQLGVAETKMLEDWLLPALNTPINATSDCIYYQPTAGREDCRTSFCEYLEDLLGLPSNQLDAEGLIVGAGCNAVLENLCFCLTQPGDAVLIPTPYYAAFEFDLVARAGLKVQPVTMQNLPENRPKDPNDPTIYYPTPRALDSAYESAKRSGHTPRILLVSHPQNPLGICYPPTVMSEAVDWCRSKQVHLISDEIYAGSVNRDGAQFESVLKLACGPGGLGPYVHWVYALSKDFGLSGLRVGAAYSENIEIRLPMQKLNDLCQVSSSTQRWVSEILRHRHTDNELWTRSFRKENHRRLLSRSRRLSATLKASDIPYLEPNSGLFVWIDLSKFLVHDAKLTDAERERLLYLELVKTHGLLLTPGHSMRNERPGHFRFVFTAASNAEFDLSLDRIRAFASRKQEPTCSQN